jgi:hypothetical protein
MRSQSVTISVHWTTGGEPRENGMRVHTMGGDAARRPMGESGGGMRAVGAARRRPLLSCYQVASCVCCVRFHRIDE